MSVAQERAEQAVRWLAEQGGESTSGRLGAVLGLNHARQAEVVAAMRAAGWLEPGKGRLRLTALGWAAVGAGELIGSGEVLDRVLSSVWPDYAAPHAAYCRLLVSAVIAKRHLWDSRPDGHLSFASMGAPGAGKTVVLQICCHILGLDWRRHVVQLDEETPGSLYGRRGQGADGGWALESSAIASLPLVLFDELDKASQAARAGVWRYLRGQGAVWIEGAEHQLRPVAMVAGNPADLSAPWALLPQGAARRAVLLDPGYLGERRRELGRHLRDVMPALRPADRVVMERLAVPADRLDAEARSVLDGLDRVVLDGLGPVPWEGLELAALGRAALLDDGGQRRAAVATCVDYLAVMSLTPGWIRADWPAAMRAVAEADTGDGRHDVVAVIDRAEAGQVRARDAARRAEIARKVEDDELVGARAEMVEGLEQLYAQLDGRRTARWSGERRRKAAAVRALLERLRQQASQSRSRAALEEITIRAEEPVRRAQDLLAAVAAEQEQARALERDRAERQRIEAERRQDMAKWQARQRRECVARLDVVVDGAKQLERYWKRAGRPRSGQTPTQALAEAGLLTFTPDPPLVRPGGFLSVLGSVLENMAETQPRGPRGQWSTEDGRPLAYGTSASCPGLESWGPATQAIIAPYLQQLYAEEDQLRHALGRVDRSTRVAIASTSSAARAEIGRAYWQ